MPRARSQNRAERVPLGSHRSKLSVADKDPNYAYRWFNDQPGRLEQAEKAGYEFVNDAATGETGDANTDLGSRTSTVVDRREGVRGYLMRIRKEWYDDDQASKQKVNDEVDRSILGGSLDGEPGKDGRYIPDSGISIKS